MTTPDELAAIRRRYPVGEWFNFTDSDAPAKLSQALTDIHSLQGALDAMTAERDKWQANFNAALDEVRADTDKLLAAESRETALRVERDHWKALADQTNSPECELQRAYAMANDWAAKNANLLAERDAALARVRELEDGIRRLVEECKVGGKA